MYHSSLDFHSFNQSLIWSGSWSWSTWLYLLADRACRNSPTHGGLQDLVWWNQKELHNLTRLSVNKPFTYHVTDVSAIHHMQFYRLHFCLMNVLFWLPFILTSRTHYLMLRIISVSLLLCFLHCFLASSVSCVAVFVRARMHVSISLHTCWHGAPEEEGRPRRRRTPRFLLKPWTRSRQASESRLGLQVKKARGEN